MFVTTASIAGCSWSDEAEPTTFLAPPPEIDLAYGPVAGCEGPDAECGGSQDVDIYRSDEPGPNPVLIWIHGGGFVTGDKAGVDDDFQPVLDAGWDIVSANYRLTLDDGTDGFPTGLQDLNRLVRWVKANAAAQDWDPAVVAAAGHSAGGNLAGMLAATAEDPTLQPTDLPPELAVQDPSIVAAVAAAPVSDLATYAAVGDADSVVRDYTNCRAPDCTEAFAAGSVQRHVDADTPPILSVHGVEDPLAPPSVGVLLGAAFDDAGIADRFQMIVIDDGPEEFRGHNLDFSRFMDDAVELLEAARDRAGS